jgi:EmrB/QacA subfamily drug resistance transporter
MAAAKPPGRVEQRGLTLLAVCAGAFMATLDTSIVNVNLPQMARDLGASLEAISWVMMAYLIANASLLLSSSQLGDIRAPGRLFFSGMLLFCLASAVCGFSGQIWQLIAARAIQGAGASLMLGVAPKIITIIYREGERGLAFGLFSTAFATGISVGAPLGAFIASTWGWPWIFFINLPLGAVAILVGGRLLLGLQSGAAWDWRGFDWQGGILFSVSISLFMWAVTQVRTQGWQDIKILAALGGACGAFLLLLLVERRQETPLLSGVLWHSRAFCLGAAAVILTFAAVMGTFFLLPFYLEEIFHLPTKTVGWMLAVLSFSNALVSPVGGLLGDRWNNLLVLRLGSLLMLGGLTALVWLGPTSQGLLVLVFAITGIGFGLFQAPNLNEMLLGVKPQVLGLAAGTNAVLKNLGALLGIALMVTMVGLGEQSQGNLRTGQCLTWPCFQRAFALSVILGAVTLICNLLPRGRSQGHGGKIRDQETGSRSRPNGNH